MLDITEDNGNMKSEP